MKRIILLAVILTLYTTAVTYAGTKREIRIAYIVKQSKLTEEQQKKVMPVLKEFLEDLSVNKKRYEVIKDKYKAADDAGKLTPKQAEELMTGKFLKDEKELALRRQYFPRFKGIVGAVKAREIIKLSDDKLNKK